MLLRHFSLSQRIKMAYVASFVFLSFVSLVLILAAAKQIEDYIFERQLSLKIADYQQQLVKGKTLQLPPNIHVYDSAEQMPDRLGRLIKQTQPGVYELDHPDGLDYHYGIAKGRNGQLQIFLFDVNDIELAEEVEHKIVQFIVLGFAILLVAFFLVFQLIVKRALAPMYILVEQIKQRQSHPEQPLTCRYPDDNELGLLNRTMVEYSERIEAFIRREREFTGFASHELRTPVTVIKGAMSLLNLKPPTDEKQQKALERIDRATTSMEDMIEILLSLSRENHTGTGDKVSLMEVVSQVIANLTDKAQTCGKTINAQGRQQAMILVEKLPAELVLTNLLRNAIQHGSGKNIDIQISADSIVISNSIESLHQPSVGAASGRDSLQPPLPAYITDRDESDSLAMQNQNDEKTEQSYGLGLVIVQRICEQHNWRYEQYQEQDKYRVCLAFSDD